MFFTIVSSSPRPVIRITSSRIVTFRRELLLERVCHDWKMHLSSPMQLTDNVLPDLFGSFTSKIRITRARK